MLVKQAMCVCMSLGCSVSVRIVNNDQCLFLLTMRCCSLL